MNYVGVDLHKETSWFCVLDNNGRELNSRNITNNINELKQFLQSIPKPFSLALESTYNWYFFVDLAQQYTDKIYLTDPYALKAFAKQHKKNDKIDAKLIAEILFKGFLPKVTIADQKTRQIRELLKSRLTLVYDRTRNINRLTTLLDKLGIAHKRIYLTIQGIKSIESNNIPDLYQDIIQDYKERLTYLTKKLYALRKQIMSIVEQDQDMQNLETIPGIGYFSAALIKSEIMDVKRFASFNRLCAYSGLAPRTFSSANKLYHGALNKNRRKYLQWIILENVYKFIKALPDKEEKFERIKKIKNHNVAKVILARDFLKIIYQVLKQQRPFYFA